MRIQSIYLMLSAIMLCIACNSVKQMPAVPEMITGAFTSDYHTGTMIPVFAFGPGAELFQGIYENTEIYSKMMQAFRWPTPDSSH